MMSEINDSITSSFLMWMAIISSYLGAVARTSSTMLSKSGESTHPHHVPDVKGNAYSFCSLSMLLAVGLSYVAFHTLGYLPSISILLRVFNHKLVLDFLKAFSRCIDMIV